MEGQRIVRRRRVMKALGVEALTITPGKAGSCCAAVGRNWHHAPGETGRGKAGRR